MISFSSMQSTRTSTAASAKLVTLLIGIHFTWWVLSYFFVAPILGYDPKKEEK